MKRALPLIALVAATLPLAAQPKAPRIRIVPQTSAGVMQVIQESKDGTRLITHDRSYAPNLWDAKRQILLTLLGGHKDAIEQIMFSPDGKYIVTQGNTQIFLWDSLKAKKLAEYDVVPEIPILDIDWSHDSKLVAAGLSNGSVALLSTPDLKEARVLKGHSNPVTAVAFSPAEMVLATGDKQGSRLWEIATGKERAKLAGHGEESVGFIHFSPDGKYILTTGTHVGKAHLSDTKTGKLLESHDHVFGWRGVKTEEAGASFVGGKDEFLLMKSDGKMEIRKIGQQQPVHTFTSHKAVIREIRYSGDGRYGATYGDDDTLRMWDFKERKELPFELAPGGPTAATFSTDNSHFWLGYQKGELRKYDVSTGKAVTTNLGPVQVIEFFGMYNEQDPYLWLYSPAISEGSRRRPGMHLTIDPEGNSGAHFLYMNWWNWEFSPDGRYVAAYRPDMESNAQIIDLKRNRFLWGLQRGNNYAWSPDSKLLMVTHLNGTVETYEVENAKGLKSWTWESTSKRKLYNGVVHPNGKWAAHTDPDSYALRLWDLETGAVLKTLGATPLDVSKVFTPDGKRLIVYSGSSLEIYDVDKGALVGEPVKVGYGRDHWKLSKDGSLLLVADFEKLQLISTADSKLVMSRPYEGFQTDLSKDGTRIVIGEGSKALILDKTGKLLSSFEHAGKVSGVQFLPGDKLLTKDEVLGAYLWDIRTGKKLATITMLTDGHWLVYDDEGRYDASDPSNVTGAYFVLEWEGGLEAIGMPQLKSQFYEPGLLSKVLGYSKEPLRDVPNLESLRLFPELTVKAAKPMVYDIQAKERDNGGVGRVSVFLNGKQVYTKKSAPYVQLDLNDYQSFLLPETRLEEGKGNMLAVTVTNEKGDLTSTPVTVDIGVPQGLKAPDVKLYALCVGVGDYVGSGGDLIAPPSDARQLGAAILEVSNKLLPNRTDVTVLDTEAKDAAQRPTRVNIMKWFEDVKGRATSSDVILVFFAGHGVSKVGDQSGYFFLTSEATPGDVTPATVATSAVSGEDLRTALSSVAANKQVVILDTCHSGAASDSLLESDRSVSGEYQRAWEAIKDTTGTWLLAGSAADQKSYESTNVEHGMLTYSLLEALDKANGEGLRQTPSGELFVDVEKWLSYAANRVESLKMEAGVKGIQKPEFKRSTKGTSFDIGVTTPERRGFIGLKAPRPIVIVGGFQMDEEDPVGLEAAVEKAMADAKVVKPWFDVAKHPNVYRMAGSYSEENGKLKVRLFLQKFDPDQTRKTLETIELEGTRQGLVTLSTQIREEIEKRIRVLEEAKAKPAGALK